MTGCCRPLEEQFDRRRVARELDAYRERGPEPTTAALARALERAGARGTLLDIGGGLGAVPALLLGNGIASAVNVEISTAYVEASRALAEEGGYADRLEHRLGDFVGLAPEIQAADVVTLDRAICCYADMERLVRLSAARARRLYGFVVPRDRWAVRAGIACQNLVRRLSGSSFRTYAHPLAQIDAVLRQAGLEPGSASRTFVWEVRVYARP